LEKAISQSNIIFFSQFNICIEASSKKAFRKYLTYAERDAMLQSKHTFVMPLHSCYQTSDTFFYVMDFARGGNLFNLLKQNPNLSLRDKKIY
jgi:serine/threonine protein kinase